jgi:hypothetical protein
MPRPPPLPPLRKGGKVGSLAVFSPLAKGGLGGGAGHAMSLQTALESRLLDVEISLQNLGDPMLALFEVGSRRVVKVGALRFQHRA